MAIGGQSYWPSAGIFVAAYSQFFMAANNNPPMGSVSGSHPRSARIRARAGQSAGLAAGIFHVWSCSGALLSARLGALPACSGWRVDGAESCSHEACQGAIQTLSASVRQSGWSIRSVAALQNVGNEHVPGSVANGKLWLGSHDRALRRYAAGPEDRNLARAYLHSITEVRADTRPNGSFNAPDAAGIGCDGRPCHG